MRFGGLLPLHARLLEELHASTGQPYNETRISSNGVGSRANLVRALAGYSTATLRIVTGRSRTVSFPAMSAARIRSV